MTTAAKTDLVPVRVRSNATFEAWQVTEDSINELARMFHGTITVDWTGAPHCRTLLHVAAAVAELGDWIIRDPDGELSAVWDATYWTRYAPVAECVDVSTFGDKDA